MLSAAGVFGLYIINSNESLSELQLAHTMNQRTCQLMTQALISSSEKVNHTDHPHFFCTFEIFKKKNGFDAFHLHFLEFSFYGKLKALLNLTTKI